MAELSEACELRSAFRFGPRGRTSCGRAMIETLAPAAACAEMFSDAPESTMFPIESAAVANAVAERRREFGTVRFCA